MLVFAIKKKHIMYDVSPTWPQMCSNMKPFVYRKYTSTYWAMHRFQNKNKENVLRLSGVYSVNAAQFVSIAQ